MPDKPVIIPRGAGIRLANNFVTLSEQERYTSDPSSLPKDPGFDENHDVEMILKPEPQFGRTGSRAEVDADGYVRFLERRLQQ